MAKLEDLRSMVDKALTDLNRPLSFAEILVFIKEKYPERDVDQYGDSIRVLISGLKKRKIIKAVKPGNKLRLFYYKVNWKVKGSIINNHIIDPLQRKFVLNEPNNPI